MFAKRKQCAGCHQSLLGSADILVCSFCYTGFPFWDTPGQARPCGTAYHPGCIVAGDPFTSRRSNRSGLRFPQVAIWPSFVCEACTVRSVLDRELGHPGDRRLLMLERMRMIDLAHAWAAGTHQQYQRKLRFLQTFQHAHVGLRLFSVATLRRPDRHPDIALMWAEELFSLRPAAARRRPAHPTAAYGTIRQLRSAMSQYSTVSTLNTHGGEVTLDPHRRLQFGVVRPTDTARMSYFSRGLRARLGELTVPSAPLTFDHIQALDNYFRDRYRQAVTLLQARHWALGGLANLLFWLGWLRSLEVFSLTWADLQVVRGAYGPTLGLPAGCGLVTVRLLPETKTNRAFRPDVYMAYRTVSGLCLGHWVLRARATHLPGPAWPDDHRRIFVSANLRPWTSQFFRQEFLYPVLYSLRDQGDPILAGLDLSPGNTIADKYWSLHCYRRGARSHVSRAHPGTGMRRATPTEVYEHGRWRRQRRNEPIDLLYQEWTPFDRVQLTLCCM